MQTKKRKMTQEFLDEIFEQVCSYQSENKCVRDKAFKALSKKYNVSPCTISKWYYKARGKNRVISTVAKKKTYAKQPSVKIAATAISTPMYAQLSAEKIIYDHIKNLNVFKRVLACICGFDKLCYNYGNKKVH